MRKFLTLISVAAVLATMSVACGGGDKTVDVPGGGKITTSGDVPDNFPDDIPVPDGADVQGSYSGKQGDVEGIVVSWTSDDSIDEVKDFYDRELADGAWTSDTKGEVGGGAFYNAVSEDGKKVAYIYIADTDGKTTILITAGDNDSASNGSNGDSSSDDGSPDDASSDDDSSNGSSDASLPDEADLPDDYPSDEVPLPSGSRVTSASSFTTGGAKTIIIEIYSKDDAKKIAAYFKSTLEGKGWTESFTTTTGNDVFASYTRTDDTSGTSDAVTVNITESGVSGYQQVGLSIALQTE